MLVRRVALALVLLAVGSAVTVGAAAPAHLQQETPTAAPDGAESLPLGAHLSGFMQASTAQTAGTVGNGLWVAAYATASNESERRALVEARVGALNTSIEELRAERQALRADYQSGTIDWMTYQARLSILVGQLAALGDGVEEASVRGRAVGVNETRLETLRSNARELGGGEVSQLARNLSGSHDPPGQAKVFDDDHPGQADERRPTQPGNGSTGAAGDGRPDSPGAGGGGQGPPTDRGQGPSTGNVTGTETPTPTPTETPTDDED